MAEPLDHPHESLAEAGTGRVRPPVIEPGHTFASVTDKISAIVLTRRTTVGWLFGLSIGFLLLMMLLMAIGKLLVTGIGTGMCVFQRSPSASCSITTSRSSKIAAPRLTDRKRITKRWRWSKNTTAALPRRKRSAIFGQAKFVRLDSKKPRAVAL